MPRLEARAPLDGQVQQNRRHPIVRSAAVTVAIVIARAESTVHVVLDKIRVPEANEEERDR